MSILDDIHDKANLARQLFPNAKESHAKHSLRAGDINDEPGASLQLDLDTGRFFDHNGKQTGDLVDVIQERLGADARGAREWLLTGGWLDPNPGTRIQPPPSPKPPPVIKPFNLAPANAPIPEPKELIALAARTEGMRFENVENPVDAEPHIYRTYTQEHNVFQPILLVVRFTLENGKKALRRMTWTGSEWMPGGSTDRGPVPLYNLPPLLKHFDSHVLILEGEKCVKAAFKMDLGRIPTCPLGGSNAAPLTDWSPLKGRDVLILPDNDNAGVTFALQVQDMAGRAGASNVSILKPLTVWQHMGGAGEPPPGWDIASPMPEPQPAGVQEQSPDFVEPSVCRKCSNLFYPAAQELQCVECS